MSAFPKIQVTERELWLLKYYNKLLPKWECEMWAKLSDIINSTDTVVEVYSLIQVDNHGTTKFIHKFQGYAVVDLDDYLIIPEDRLLS